MNEKGFEVKTFGLPLWLACVIAIIAIAGTAAGALSTTSESWFVLIQPTAVNCNERGAGNTV